MLSHTSASLPVYINFAGFASPGLPRAVKFCRQVLRMCLYMQSVQDGAPGGAAAGGRAWHPGGRDARPVAAAHLPRESDAGQFIILPGSADAGAQLPIVLIHSMSTFLPHAAFSGSPHAIFLTRALCRRAGAEHDDIATGEHRTLCDAQVYQLTYPRSSRFRMRWTLW